MRVSTQTFQLQWLNAINDRQQALADIQRQVSTGRRLLTAGDDPAGAAQLIVLQDGLNRLDSYASNADAARRRLSLEERALDGATGILDRVRELAIQSGGATQSEESRRALANEARELLSNLLDVANTQDGEGRYLFAGNRVEELPFVLNNGTVSYAGDDGSRFQRIGDNREVAEGDPGSTVFAAIRNGNGTFSVSANAANTGGAFFSAGTVTDLASWPSTPFTIRFTTSTDYAVLDSGGSVVQTGTYAPGDSLSFAGASVRLEGTPAAGDEFAVEPSVNQDVFTTVERFVLAMESGLSNPSGRALAQSEVNATLQDLDQALANIELVRSNVGSRLRVIDDQSNLNEELGLQFTRTASLVRDVDYATAISELEQQLIGLEAAQKTFSRTRASSLFNLI